MFDKRLVFQNPYLQSATLAYCENEVGLRQIVTHAGTLDVINTSMIGTYKISSQTVTYKDYCLYMYNVSLFCQSKFK